LTFVNIISCTIQSKFERLNYDVHVIEEGGDNKL